MSIREIVTLVEQKDLNPTTTYYGKYGKYGIRAEASMDNSGQVGSLETTENPVMANN